jgi:catechol 2,3-dioxygenase-like lactoylglutathione lyase family enzyme
LFKVRGASAPPPGAAVAGIDHVALPTADAERLLAFYKTLGFISPDEAAWRAGRQPTFALACGDMKLNIHPEGFRAALRGETAEPGCADLCFVWGEDQASLEARLAAAGTSPIAGPVERVGGRAGGTVIGMSIYARDPDGNLLEFITY